MQRTDSRCVGDGRRGDERWWWLDVSANLFVTGCELFQSSSHVAIAIAQKFLLAADSAIALTPLWKRDPNEGHKTCTRCSLPRHPRVEEKELWWFQQKFGVYRKVEALPSTRNACLTYKADRSYLKLVPGVHQPSLFKLKFVLFCFSLCVPIRKYW